MTAAEIAEVLGMALSTVSRWLKRIGLGKRSRLSPPEPLRAQAPRRADPRRHQEAGAHPATRSSRHRQPPRPLHRRPWLRHRRLGVRPRLRGRRHPPRLRRGACRRARRHRHRLLATGRPVVRLDGHRRREGDERQRLLLPLSCTCERLPGTRAQAPLHPAIPASDKWQGRAIHPDAPEPLGLRRDLCQLSRANRSPSWLAHPLQLHPTTWLPRPQDACGSAHRAGTTS
jgi:hypothetical protein